MARCSAMRRARLPLDTPVELGILGVHQPPRISCIGPKSRVAVHLQIRSQSINQEPNFREKMFLQEMLGIYCYSRSGSCKAVEVDCKRTA